MFKIKLMLEKINNNMNQIMSKSKYILTSGYNPMPTLIIGEI